MRRLFTNKGFTLIELVIVIVILGVLAGIAAPKMIGSIKTSRINAAITSIKTIEQVASRLYLESPDASTAPTTANITAGVGKIPAGITVTSCAVTNNGANTVLNLVITINPTQAGVTLADINSITNPLAGTFAASGTSFTYTNATLQ